MQCDINFTGRSPKRTALSQNRDPEHVIRKPNTQRRILEALKDFPNSKSWVEVNTKILASVISCGQIPFYKQTNPIYCFQFAI